MTILKHEGRGPQRLKIFKDPNSVLDYRIIWGPWLQTGETVFSREWITDGVYTIDSNTSAASETINNVVYTDIEIVTLSGGTVGSDGTITNRITTSNGRVIDRSFILTCKEQ